MAIIDTFRQRLADGEVILIDGGMGPELMRRGVPMHEYAWAAPAVLTHADTVRQAHEDYIRAGADAIITNTFMASRFSMELSGLDFEEVNRRSTEVAVQARKSAADRPVLVVGSLFPGSFGADLDTMLPEDLPTDEEVASAVREQASLLVGAGADVLNLEMPPSGHWGGIALEAVADLAPVWISPAYGRHTWTDGTELVLPNDPPGQIGELVRQALARSGGADVMSINVMHTQIEDIGEALDLIAPYWDGTLGAYPHHGEHSKEAPGFLPTHVDPADLVDASLEWVDRGVQIIGGCCGIGPEHIEALKDRLPDHVPAGAK